MKLITAVFILYLCIKITKIGGSDDGDQSFDQKSMLYSTIKNDKMSDITQQLVVAGRRLELGGRLVDKGE